MCETEFPDLQTIQSLFTENSGFSLSPSDWLFFLTNLEGATHRHFSCAQYLIVRASYVGRTKILEQSLREKGTWDGKSIRSHM